MAQAIPFDDFGGTGPDLHFAHANGYPPACYKRLIGHFQEDYRVLAVHHRPLWPGSSPEEMARWSMIADDLIHFFDQEGLRQVIGVGHSLGAVVTIMAAVRRPELFSRLVLIEPVLLMPAILTLFSMQPEMAFSDDFPLVGIARSRRNEWEDRQEAFDHFRRKRVFARWSDEILWDYIWHGLERNESGNLSLAYAPEWEARVYALPPTEIWDLVPQVKQPTLALRGSETDTLVPAAWELWKINQPEATFVELAGTGHLLTMEKPAEIAGYIRQFLSR